MLYTQLTRDERKIIDYLFNQEKRSISFIAKKLGKNKSTISREIKRNSGIDGYECSEAHEHYKKRQQHKYCMHMLKYQEFSNLFIKFYDKRCHGIEATHNKIKTEYPDIKIPSVRQMFNWIRSDKWSIKSNDKLRAPYQKGRKIKKEHFFEKFKNKHVLPIWLRPKYVNLREEYGHWEVDLIVGSRARGFSNLVTFTERKTRETYIAKIQSKNPWLCNSAINNLIKKNNLIVKTITCDNGLEFNTIGILAKWHNIKIYRCQPYASYQRGSNEHANGLIRRFYQKGTNFSLINDEEIENVQNKINQMPRKIFNWLSSLEYKKELLNNNKLLK